MRDEYNFSNAKRGAVLSTLGKKRITIMLDDEVIEAFRALAGAEGRGYQTLINAVLRESLVASNQQPITTETLRPILREELHPA